MTIEKRRQLANDDTPRGVSPIPAGLKGAAPTDSAFPPPVEPDDLTFPILQRLTDPAVNRRLLAALDARGSSDDAFARANLLRRMGDIVGARAEIRRWLESETKTAVPDDWSAIPSRLTSHGGYALAPLVLIDDFLPRERMLALHRHACARQAEFRDALATNAHSPPRYDPERRQTLVDGGFTLERGEFLSFLSDNLPRLCRCLGIEPFEIDRVELKLTNHVHGGFFRTHRDNHDPHREPGRAITWLYYFGGSNTAFEGGELYLFDSKPAQKMLSPAWFTRVEAVPNRLIAFPSSFYHAVGPTQLPGGTFAQGRFAVSSHIRKAADTATVWWEFKSIVTMDQTS